MRTPQEIREYKRQWTKKNHARLFIKRKKWEFVNRERLALYQKEYGVTNKDAISLKSKEYYEKNKEKIKARARHYSKNNRLKINENNRARHLWRRENDEQFHLRGLLRARLRKVLKTNAKVGSAVRDLGCSVAELRFFLEGKFKDGMTWSNHGVWHLDHIIPLSFFDLTDRAQLLQAVHYTNLQPLWGEENLLKRMSDGSFRKQPH